MRTNVYDLIAQLANLRGISGREAPVGETAASMLRAHVPDAKYEDGSVTAHLGSDPEKPMLLFCAHLDQVGFMVTDITEDGFLRIGQVGGIDRRLLLGQAVTVCGSEDFPGVISILPPHLLQGDQAVPEQTAFCVDVGFDSAEALRGKIAPGDAVYYATACKRLQNNRITGQALDNRCGVAAVLLAAEKLAETENLPCNVTFVLSGQEERSGRGAKIAAANQQPDCAVAVDTTFGLAHNENPQETFRLGGGPAVGISPVLDAALSGRLIALAKRNDIPWQPEVMTGKTGTDADSLAFAPGGCRTATVSVPLRYMHTPVEVIDLTDVQYTANLLVLLAKECGQA